MGNQESFEVSNQRVVEDEPGRYRDGIDNPVDVLEEENTNLKGTGSHIQREDSYKAALEDSIVTDAEDATTVDNDIASSGETTCGIGPCRPRWLQWLFGGPKAFTLFSVTYLLIRTASAIFLGVALSTIEKQFQLSSTESGAITILSDVMDMVLVTFVAYFGQQSHRPRIIGFGVFLVGFGLVLCAVPHYLLQPYTHVPQGCNETEPFVDYCTADLLKKEDPCMVQFEQPGFNPVWWLFIGQIFVGIGNVPMKPLGTTYIDDAVGTHTTPLYIAILFSAVSIGPILAYTLGSTTLSIYVDFDRVAPEDRPTFEDNDPRFIGAWWLGFLCIGCFIILLSVPFFFFPKKLPVTKERAEEESEKAKKALANGDGGLKMKAIGKGSESTEAGSSEFGKYEEAKKDALVHKTVFGKAKEAVRKYIRMLTNVALLLLCVSSAMESANAAGLGTFALKYNEIVFALTAAEIARLGYIVIPFGLLGTLIGGYVIKRKKWSTAGVTLLLLFGQIVGLLSIPFLLAIGCKTQAIAGVSKPYVPPAPYSTFMTSIEPVNPLDSVQQAISSCNLNCTCGNEDYNPVCGSDGLTYVSPCYAGCEVVESSKDELNRTVNSFSDCRCINNLEGLNATVTDGECTAECKAYYIPLLVGVLVIYLFCTSLGTSGLVLIVLRIVEDDMRATALGFQSVTSNLLGFVSAPIFFGALFNTACIVWAYDDGNRGACWVYDRVNTRFAFYGLQGGIKLVSFVVLMCVYFILRTPKWKKYEARDVDEPDKKNENVA